MAPQAADTALTVGAARMKVYLPQLAEKKIGLVVNQTSRVGGRHLIDTLLARGVTVVKAFAPEHGFRGEADAGARIVDGRDPDTGLPVISLYGRKKKPTADDLRGLDLVVFDIQDVGARFYTYLSTLHYVMEACAENGVPVMVLDRPNPNGHYVDGPVLDMAYRSFVGMHPVPVVHGMTVGEYARMINGEGWLEGSRRCALEVIPCAYYDHRMAYRLPVRPSPNLPNMRAVYLYPSLCFFEGTTVSVGRGTERQFQVYGHPDFPGGDYAFTPEPRPGARHPKHQGKVCRGFSLTDRDPSAIRAEGRLNLSHLLDFYRDFPDPDAFFRKNGFFDLLAGSDRLRKQIMDGATEAEIRAGWQSGIQAFRARRKPYLLYPE